MSKETTWTVQITNDTETFPDSEHETHAKARNRADALRSTKFRAEVARKDQD